MHLRFEDGVEADPDLGELISCQGPSRLFGTWHTFAELRLHPELATICWPGRADLDSDVLYASASGKLIDLSHSGSPQARGAMTP